MEWVVLVSQVKIAPGFLNVRLLRSRRLTALMGGLLLAAAPASAQTSRPALYVDAGACPSECCTYGQWWAIRPVQLHAEPRSDAALVGMVSPGDTVVAETGEVRTIPTPFLVKAPMEEYAPGDTIWVLTYLGEGYFRVWVDGEVRELGLDFSPYGGSSGARCQRCDHGELLTSHRSEWWVRIRTAAGVTGWTMAPDSFSGEHSCGME
jgi:hypothetical protein